MSGIYLGSLHYLPVVGYIGINVRELKDIDINFLYILMRLEEINV